MQPWTEALLKRLTSGSVPAGFRPHIFSSNLIMLFTDGFLKRFPFSTSFSTGIPIQSCVKINGFIRSTSLHWKEHHVRFKLIYILQVYMRFWRVSFGKRYRESNL